MSGVRGNIAENAAPALTQFEQECADLDAKDWNPRQIACVLERGEGAVLQALKSARLKMEAGRAEVSDVRQSAAHLRRDVEAVAMNYRTEETPRVQVAGTGKAARVEDADPLLRWVRWPFRDRAAQAG